MFYHQIIIVWFRIYYPYIREETKVRTTKIGLAPTPNRLIHSILRPFKPCTRGQQVCIYVLDLALSDLS